MSPRFRSSAVLIFLACVLEASYSASTSNFLLSVSLSASIPARRELIRVGLADSLLTVSVRDFLLGAGLGAGLAGMTFLAVAEISVRSALFAAMFSCRLLSKALISVGSFLIGILLQLRAVIASKEEG